MGTWVPSPYNVTNRIEFGRRIFTVVGKHVYEPAKGRWAQELVTRHWSHLTPDEPPAERNSAYPTSDEKWTT